MVSTPKPPKPPDPREIAETDAEFNRIDQFTPFGSLQFSGPSRNVSTLTFNPEIQAAFDERLAVDRNLLGEALGRFGSIDTEPIDLSQFGEIQSAIPGVAFQDPRFQGLPALTAPELGTVSANPEFQGDVDVSGLPAIPGDIDQFRTNVEQAVFDRGRALLDPVFADQERALRQRLSNQGLPFSGEARDRALTRFNESRERAFTDLADRAVISGGSEASRALGDVLRARGQGVGEALSLGAFGNAAEQAQLAAALASQGFNNQAGLLGLGANQGIRGQLTGEELAQTQAINQARQATLGLQQQNLANANAARAQALAEAQGIRGNQFNELASLLGLQQVQAPGLNQFFAPAPANVTGGFALNQQAQQNAFNSQVAQNNAMLGGLFGLGGALLGGPLGGQIFGGLFGGGDRRAGLFP